MKNILLLLSLVFAFSCSVQKRKYQKGFYVNRVHHKTQTNKSSDIITASEKKESTIAAKEVISRSTGDRPELAALDNSLIVPDLKRTVSPIESPPDTCDVLIFKDGSEIRAKVTEIAPSDVKYKRCDNPDGPSYITRKADLFMIKYVNGTKEVMKADPVAESEIVTHQKPNPKYNKQKAKQHPLALPALIFGAFSIVSIYIGLLISATSMTGEPVSPFAIAASVVSALLGIILGQMAMSDIKNSEGTLKGKGLAMPGSIIGIVMASIWAMIGLAFLI